MLLQFKGLWSQTIATVSSCRQVSYQVCGEARNELRPKVKMFATKIPFRLQRIVNRSTEIGESNCPEMCAMTGMEPTPGRVTERERAGE